MASVLHIGGNENNAACVVSAPLRDTFTFSIICYTSPGTFPMLDPYTHSLNALKPSSRLLNLASQQYTERIWPERHQPSSQGHPEEPSVLVAVGRLIPRGSRLQVSRLGMYDRRLCGRPCKPRGSTCVTQTAVDNLRSTPELFRLPARLNRCAYAHRIFK